MACICARSCGENRTDPDCPECGPRLAQMRAESFTTRQAKEIAAKTGGHAMVYSRQHRVAVATMRLARDRRMEDKDGKLPESMRMKHLEWMLGHMMSDSDMNDGKLGRWLGWMQASIVAADCATMEEFRSLWDTTP